MNPEKATTSSTQVRHTLRIWGLVFTLLCGTFSAAVAADATVIGLSGTMLVPGLEVMAPGTARGAFHFVGNEVEHEASLKGVFAYNDDTEIAVMKRFVTGRGKDQYDPVFAAKFKVRPNLALAGVIDTTVGYKDSVMLLTGVPGNRVVLGVGANIAMEATERYAHFGRYEDPKSEVDPLFFIMGADIHVDDDTDVTLDYTGNDFVLGLRHRFNEVMAADFGYFTPDRLREESRYCLGLNFGF
ncbi:MAG TPA: hypothetical protein PKO06_20040 [Candidatus Ozemobacteraceae bacterium]|nr:hypothetical protein [Candidatus Ozemobacteraceae bacterium]